MVQILSGLITFLMPAIYCQEKHGEPASIARVRQLRSEIRNEAALLGVNHFTLSRGQRKKQRRERKKLQKIS